MNPLELAQEVATQNHLELGQVSPVYAELAAITKLADAHAPEPVQDMQRIIEIRNESQQMRSAADEMYVAAQNSVTMANGHSRVNFLTSLLKIKHDAELYNQIKTGLIPAASGNDTLGKDMLLFELALVVHGIGEARRVFHQIATSDPAPVYPLTMLACAEAEVGDYTAAIYHIQAIQGESARAEAWFKYAMVLVARGDYGAALQVAERIDQEGQVMETREIYTSVAVAQPTPEHLALVHQEANQYDNIEIKADMLSQIALASRDPSHMQEIWDAGGLERIQDQSMKIRVMIRLAPLYPDRGYYSLAEQAIREQIQNRLSAVQLLCLLAKSKVRERIVSADEVDGDYFRLISEAVGYARHADNALARYCFREIAETSYAIAEMLEAYADSEMVEMSAGDSSTSEAQS